jgi:hypothetical protein
MGALGSVDHLNSEGVVRMANQRRIEARRVLLRILGEVAGTVAHDTPTRAATAAVAASLLMRLLGRDTLRKAS